MVMTPFDAWLVRWSLTVDGSPKRTASSDLLPVLYDNVPAMLKVARSREERRGASILGWYAGQGAVRVLAIDGPALLLERARGRIWFRWPHGSGPFNRRTCLRSRARERWLENL